MTASQRFTVGPLAILLGAFFVALTIAGGPMGAAILGTTLAAIGACAITPQPRERA